MCNKYIANCDFHRVNCKLPKYGRNIEGYPAAGLPPSLPSRPHRRLDCVVCQNRRSHCPDAAGYGGYSADEGRDVSEIHVPDHIAVFVGCYADVDYHLPGLYRADRYRSGLADG